MPQRTVVIGSRSGLHARPASLFVKAANSRPVKVTVGREGQPPVDARSLLSVLGLAIKHGEPVVLTAEGAEADAALDELAALIAGDLDGAESR